MRQLSTILAFVAAMMCGSSILAQNPAIGSGNWDVLNSNGTDIGDMTTTASSSTAGTWSATVNGVMMAGTYSYNSTSKEYQFYMPGDPPVLAAEVWYDTTTGKWRWRLLVSGETGTLRVKP